MSDDKWLWLFEWLEYTTIGTAVRDSVWMFPVIEAVHLIGLCFIGGTVLTVDLRMLGLGMTRQSIGELAQNLRPWLIGAVVLMFATGTLLFLSEAVKCYYNQSFWVKMVTLPAALAFTFTIKGRMTAAEGLEVSTMTRIVAVVSMLLWFTVAAAGRWIGFS